MQSKSLYETISTDTNKIINWLKDNLGSKKKIHIMQHLVILLLLKMFYTVIKLFL